MVDDADVQQFVDALMKDEPFARAPNAELAYRLAISAQGVARMTSGYAEEFALQGTPAHRMDEAFKPTRRHFLRCVNAKRGCAARRWDAGFDVQLLQ